ncbi:phage tail protein [Vibrio mimicus]
MNYKAVLTNVGLDIINAAYNAGKTVTLATIELGDGGGSDITPTPDATSLVGSFGSQPITKGRSTNAAISILVRVDSKFDGNVVREFGLRDSDGNLIIYANHPASEVVAGQPLPLEIGCDMYIENASAVNIVVDTACVSSAFPVNATLALKADDALYVDENGAQWLRSGVTLTNVEDYPLATVTEIPEIESIYSNIVDTSALPSSESMKDVTETNEHYVASTSNGYFVILSKDNGSLIEVTPAIASPKFTYDIASSNDSDVIYYPMSFSNGNIGKATESEIRTGTTTGSMAFTIPNASSAQAMTINGTDVIYVDGTSHEICLTDTNGAIRQVLINHGNYTGGDIASVGDALYTTRQGGGDIYYLSAYSLSALKDGNEELLFDKDIGEIVTYGTSIGLVAIAQNEFLALTQEGLTVKAVRFKINTNSGSFVGLTKQSFDPVTGLPIYIRIG